MCIFLHPDVLSYKSFLNIYIYVFPSKMLLRPSGAGQSGRRAASDQTAAVRASKIHGGQVFFDSIDSIDTLIHNS